MGLECGPRFGTYSCCAGLGWRYGQEGEGLVRMEADRGLRGLLFGDFGIGSGGGRGRNLCLRK